MDVRVQQREAVLFWRENLAFECLTTVKPVTRPQGRVESGPGRMALAAQSEGKFLTLSHTGLEQDLTGLGMDPRYIT